jgi:hypothetical protein
VNAATPGYSRTNLQFHGETVGVLKIDEINALRRGRVENRPPRPATRLLPPLIYGMTLVVGAPGGRISSSPINTTRTVLPKEIEDLREARA